MSNVENPEYKVITSQDNIEIRDYKPMIIAKVEIAGGRKKSINDGFRLLADYIFGNNIVQKKINMTAPIQQQSKKIAMTAPVQQQFIGNSWTISFVMPSKYDMESLPKPNNDLVSLNAILAKKFVVIKFSGTNSDKNINQHEKQLMEYIKYNQIKTSGVVKYAFYNPPWTLPFMRRNEAMFEIKE